MEDKCLKILQDNVKLEELLNEDFIHKPNENFEDVNMFPISITFAINLIYRNDKERNDNTVMVDVSVDPKNMSKIIDSLK